MNPLLQTLLASAAMLGVVNLTAADPVVLDFEQVPPPPLDLSTVYASSLTSQGFLISAPHFEGASLQVPFPNAWNWPGSKALTNNTEGGVIVIAREDNGTFDLVSFDHILRGDDESEAYLYGMRADGSFIELYLGAETIDFFTTLTLAGFTNLNAVVFCQGQDRVATVDNIVLDNITPGPGFPADVTLNFESFAQNNTGFNPLPRAYYRDGYLFAGDRENTEDLRYGTWGQLDSAFAGSTAFGAATVNGRKLHISRIDHQPFTLVSFNAATHAPSVSTPTDITVVPTSIDGELAAELFTHTDPNPDARPNFVTYTRNTAGVVDYYIRSFPNSLQYDDIVLTTAVVPACAADFNTLNGVTVQDIFDFLTAWLAGSSSADFNTLNGVTVQDIFDFLTAWLAGC